MLKISEMSGKLKNIQAINTNPLSNNYCMSMNSLKDNSIICTACYSCAMLNAYRKNCVPAFERNSIYLSEKEIDSIPKFSKKNNIVRIHAHGELINDMHLLNILKIVNNTKDKTFSLYTKRLDIINNVFDKEIKPDNLILVYSNPIIDNPVNIFPKHIDKIFNVCRNNYMDRINCGAKNCNGCRNCYDKAKENIIYEKIK
jgi:hypothetical protein